MRYRRVLWRGAVAPTRGISLLRRRPGGFPVIVAPLSTSAFGGLATGEPSPPGLLRGLIPDEVDFICRRLRVAARPSRAVTPAREPSRYNTPARVSRGPKALRGSPEGSALWWVSKGQSPLAGCQGSALTGVQGQRPWRHPTVISTTEQAGRRSVLPSMPVKSWTDRGALAKSL